jgi:glutaredoxin 3
MKKTADIVMYSKDPCPYCVAAKNFLNEREIPFREIDLTGQQEEIDRIKAETGWRTVPIILINGELVGGFMDLKALEDQGKLEALLQA